MRYRTSDGAGIMRPVPLGNFKSVQLNVVGWGAALGPTTLIGALLGYVTSDSAAGAGIGSVIGAAAGFVVARFLDARHDTRRWSNIAVTDAEEATAELRNNGLPASPGVTVLDGKPFDYVTVRSRDFFEAARIVGLQAASTRGRRRARQAQAKAFAQMMNEPTL